MTRATSIMSACVAIVVAMSALLSMGCRTTAARGGIGYHYLVEVRQGDSLASIAARHGTTWRAIASENNLRDYRDIEVGQRLRVTPGPGGYTAGERLVTGAAMPTGMRVDVSALDDGEMIPGLGSGPEEELTDQDLSPGPNAVARKARPSVNEGVAFLIWPTKGDVSSYFGKRGRRMHKGIDIKAPRGASVVAAADGKVVHTGYQSRGYGRFVVIDHGGLRTLYGHLLRIGARVGAVVRQGDLIGLVGRTGRSTGYHLHFELRDDEAVPMDPIPYIKNENLVSLAP